MIATKKVSPPLKWHGGKHDLADWIIGLMPPRCRKPNSPEEGDTGWLHYVEPFAGGLSVLLANDPEGISEVANDLNQTLTIFWRVLGSDAHFPDFLRRAEATPFSEAEWDREPEAVQQHGKADLYLEAVESAFRFFVKCRQSLSGRMKGFAGITRNRTRRGMNEQVSAWLNAIEGLPAVHARLKRVLIRNQPAFDIIRKEDGPRTLFYLDPPYLHETRATTGEYEHEMSDGQHEQLLLLLGGSIVKPHHMRNGIQGRFMLSGYHSELYDDTAKAFGWKCHEKQLPNSAAGGKVKRVMTECVWTNF